VVDALLDASPLALVLYAMWKLPDWARKWIVVARELRAFRAER